MSLAVVGAAYQNQRGPTRKFEIAVSTPGEPVELRREPKNPADSRAIGVYSARGVQIGYIRAEQAQWIGSMLESVTGIFQRADTFGAVIRVTFDGSVPVLTPEQSALPAKPKRQRASDWPPPEPDDDYSSI